MLEKLLGAWLGDTDRVSLRLFDQLIARFRRLCLLAFVINLAAALLEGTTMGVLALAIQILVGDIDSLSSELGSLGASAETYAARHGPQRLFMGLVVLAVAAQVLRSVLQFGGTAAIARLQSRSEGLVRRRLFSRFLFFESGTGLNAFFFTFGSLFGFSGADSSTGMPMTQWPISSPPSLTVSDGVRTSP